MLTKFGVNKKDVKIALPSGKRAQNQYLKTLAGRKQVAEIGGDKRCFKISGHVLLFF